MKIRLSKPSKTKELLREYGIELKRSLGQNLLIDNNILGNIIRVADIKKDDTVIEVGAGLGALTQELAETAGRVKAVELDERLVSILKKELTDYENVEIIQGDALEVDFDQLGGKEYKVVANLPYNVANPIIMRLLEEDFSVKELTVMVQKEVAERITASPGGKEYGRLSIGIQYHAEPEIKFTVPPTVFIPQPKVESAVVGFKVRDEPKVKVEDEEFFFKVVKAAFQQRRKTIRNALRKAAELDLNREEVDEALKRADIDSRRRGEKLNLAQFGRLSDELFEIAIDTGV